jgi:hypothetical protein
MPSHAACGASIRQSTSGSQNLNLNLNLLPIHPGVAGLLGWLPATAGLIARGMTAAVRWTTSRLSCRSWT